MVERSSSTGLLGRNKKRHMQSKRAVLQGRMSYNMSEGVEANVVLYSDDFSCSGGAGAVRTTQSPQQVVSAVDLCSAGDRRGYSRGRTADLNREGVPSTGDDRAEETMEQGTWAPSAK